MRKLLFNQNGHGQVPSGKEMLKIIGILLTAPISFPVLILIDKIKEKRKEKDNK